MEIKRKDKYSLMAQSCSGMLKIWTTITENPVNTNESEIHAHYDDLEVYWFIGGELFFSFEGLHIPVNEGDMIVIANGFLHKPIIISGSKYIRKRIRFHKDIFKQLSSSGLELFNILSKRKILLCPSETVKANRLDEYFDEIEKSIGENTAYGDFRALIDLFNLLIKAEKYSIDVLGINKPKQNEKILAITEYIDNHISDELSYREISAKFFISEKSLYKLFKQELGFTLGDYINERRIIIARSMMNSGMSATDASFAVGYKDYSVFFRNFVKRTGITPSELMRSEDI